MIYGSLHPAQCPEYKSNLLCITFSEGEFSGNMEHNLSSMEGGENCLISCLAVRHIQTSLKSRVGTL